MIVLDTNVMSELMRPEPSPAVANWAVRVGLSDLRLTAITRAEILSGIAILPHGRRRQALEIAANRTFDLVFNELLPFDAQAADHYAEIVAIRRRSGRATAPIDMMIAAIARAHGAAVATRNIIDFEECGIVLHDLWQDK